LIPESESISISDQLIPASLITSISAQLSDNCTAAEELIVTISRDSFDCSDAGQEVPVVITVSDLCGNTASCETIVSVMDTSTPMVEAVADVILEVDPGVCETQITYPELLVTDNCDVSIEQLAGLGADGLFVVGTTLETWLVSDGFGNSTEISFNVVVETSNALPTINAIADMETEEDAGTVNVPFSGVSYGVDCQEQDLTVTAMGMNPVLVSEVVVNYTPGETVGSLDLTLAPDQSGLDTIKVLVTDSEGAMVTELFMISVTAVNDAPYLVVPIPDGMVNASFETAIPVSSILGILFDDVDDDVLDFTIGQLDGSSLPLWATLANDLLTVKPMLADTGMYTFVVTATDAAGATAADTFSLFVDGYPTSTEDINSGEFELNMYPNPSKGEVNLKINSSEILDTEVVVRSISGSEVFRKKYKASEQIVLDLTEDVSGVYLISIQQGDKAVIKKLILDRK